MRQVASSTEAPNKVSFGLISSAEALAGIILHLPALQNTQNNRKMYDVFKGL
jgi:hypothetical protein